MLKNAPREHSAILSTFIKLPFVFKILVSSIFEWPLKKGFTGRDRRRKTGTDSLEKPLDHLSLLYIHG